MTRFSFVSRGGLPPRRLRPSVSERLEPRTLLAAFVVTTPADDGPGSLRQAILSANAAPGDDTVSFALPGAPGTVHTLRPASPLPPIGDALTLDATTQPGYTTSPLIELDGSAAGPDADGLTVVAGPTTVKGFAVNRFGRHGVFVNNPDGPSSSPSLVSVDRNYVGTDPSGSSALPNGGAGITVAMAAGPRRVVHVRGNVASGNQLAGVWLTGLSGSLSPNVDGNFIGTNAAGTAAVPNGTFGVLVEGSTPMVRSNVISGNRSSGVRVIGTDLPPNTARAAARIHANLIGTNGAGTAAIPNGHSAAALFRDGVTVTGPASVDISGNTVSGNAARGVALLADPDDGMRAEITNNLVGTDAAGAAPLGNGADGVYATGVTFLHAAGNTVSANAGNGVAVVNAPRTVPTGSILSTVIDRNKIGTDQTGARPLGNAGNGVELRNSSHVRVGGPNVLDQPPGIPEWEPIPPGTYQNVISSNGGHGIYVVASGTISQPSQIRIIHNLVGSDWRGRASLGNRGSGIYLAGVVVATIGGVIVVGGEETWSGTHALGNTIISNGGDGITVSDLNGTPSVSNPIEMNDVGRLPRVPGVPFGNAGWGVAVINSSRTTVGATDRLNTITANGRGGVLVRSSDTAAERNTISTNSIHANGGPGIDLAGDGVTPNDVLDADAGPNRLQNFPVITRVTRTGAEVVVTLRLHSTPLQTFRIELFRSPRPDPSGHGEGERLLRAFNVTTDADGNATGSVTLPTTDLPATTWLSATATHAGGDTSEFSVAVSALAGRPAFRPTYRPPPPDASLAAAAPTKILSEPPTRRGAPPPRGLLA